MHVIKITTFTLLLLVGYSCSQTKEVSANKTPQGIRIDSTYPFYWNYQGEPVLLLGGTKEDNIFQIDSLRAHLELLKSVGGNYIRCTMSSRDQGNLRAYQRNTEGLYDLNQFNSSYWEKLKNLLDISQELDIIVQIEIWATYDFYWGDLRWSHNPFNPTLNINYDSQESGLPDSVDYPAQSKVNPFFNTVPDRDNNELVLRYQKKFVDKLLSIAFEFDNVLYCMDNETTAHHDWGKFWARYVRKKAEESGKEVFVTEMWDSWDPTEGVVAGARMQHPDMGGWYAQYTNPDLHETAHPRFTLNNTDDYQFVDISNHNTQEGEIHYQTASWVRDQVIASGKIRPINNVKIYGADSTQDWSGTIREGKQRFWRDIFAGHATARFHRPNGGLGLNKMAQNNIRSMRMLTDSVDFFEMKPAIDFITDRDANEAYGMMGNGEYLIYFPSGGEVRVNIEAGKYEIRWLDIENSQWGDRMDMDLPGLLTADQRSSSALYLKRK